MFGGFETIEPEALRRRVEAEPISATMGELLDQAVARFGDREALNFFDDGVSVTWREYRAMVDRAANALRSVGIAKGTHVALLMPNGIEFPVIWLALGRLGAVLVPVNTGYTARELRYVLEDSEAEFLILHSALLPAYEMLDTKPVPAARVITLGEASKFSCHHWPALYAAADGIFTSRDRVEPDDLLNIQYTSGTTGFPKGCMLSHRYWVTIGKTCAGCMGAVMDRVYGGYNFFYMICQRMLAHCLFHGSSLYVPGKPSIRRFMPDMRAHACDYTTVFESSVYKQPVTDEDGRNALKLVNTFGLNKAYHDDFQRRFHVPAQEWYGMTEVGLVLYTPIHRVPEMIGTGTAGVEAPFARLMIADENGKAVKQGEPGELCVKGPAILHGYFNKKEANADSFRDGWFRTGDQFRQDANGYFYIVGRFKDMIRRSGENIAAREVEAVLRTLPEIQDAAVVPVPDDYRGEEVKAYLMLMPGISKDRLPPTRVVEHCAAHLAAFKVPRYIEYRDALPRTESGRVQKKVLIAEKPDLRAGSYDRQNSVWR